MLKGDKMNNRIKTGKKILVAILIIILLFGFNNSYGSTYKISNLYRALFSVVRTLISVACFIGMIIYCKKSKKETKYKIFVFIISLVNIILLNLLLRACGDLII